MNIQQYVNPFKTTIVKTTKYFYALGTTRQEVKKLRSKEQKLKYVILYKDNVEAALSLGY